MTLLEIQLNASHMHIKTGRAKNIYIKQSNTSGYDLSNKDVIGSKYFLQCHKTLNITGFIKAAFMA